MTPVVAQEDFTEEELTLLQRATRMVDSLDAPDGRILGIEIRCHELARAVGSILQLPVSDGRYGMRGSIEHSWLRVGNWQDYYDAKILDVYVPGACPQVQLLLYGNSFLPTRELYVQGVQYERTDVNEGFVDHLVELMKDK